MQGMDDGFCDVGVALFEGLEDAHQHGLRFGTIGTAMTITGFAHHERVADRAFGAVVVKRNLRMVQKHKQLVTMSPQTFHRSFRLVVRPCRFDPPRHASFDALAQSLLLRFFRRRTLAASCCAGGNQSHRVTQNSFQSFCKRRPIVAFVAVLRDFFQVAEQMYQTFLLGCHRRNNRSLPPNSFVRGDSRP